MNDWLMHIPISEEERNPTKVEMIKPRTRIVAENHEPQKIQETPSAYSYSFNSQSGFGQAADICIFGAPVGVFR